MKCNEEKQSMSGRIAGGGMGVSLRYTGQGGILLGNI